MSKPHIKIVVWDSIGNTLLGVRPWTSQELLIKGAMLRERPDAETVAAPTTA